MAKVKRTHARPTGLHGRRACDLCKGADGVVAIQRRIGMCASRFDTTVRYWCLACRKQNTGTYRLAY
jgi:hypothetical protein